MTMNKKEIMKLLKFQIKRCYKDLLYAKSNISRKKWIEGFRCRLDELILLYQHIKDVSFVESCKELGIEYKDLEAKK